LIEINIALGGPTGMIVKQPLAVNETLLHFLAHPASGGDAG
jgi:hypothetical protein